MTGSMPEEMPGERLELWGGVECTVARVGDDYRDQSRETGHTDRIEDLDRIAALGIRTLRYPVLWETVSPDSPDEADFAAADQRLARLRDLDIKVIAGLCHHGSGPRYTSLLDPVFPELLARHARRVAERYPHLRLYTPVNEPLTTARFSGLYGHWYPHARDPASLLKALVIECKATLLALREIRRVRPDAGLVQTDDFGKTFSTPLLAYQADHDNERRWLGWDLLCGRVAPGHPFWRAFLEAGVPQGDLELLMTGEAAPEIIGVNHYLTSERYLDQRLARYPEYHWGGNGRHRFADAEAVRTPIPHDDIGPAARLREVWARYRLPLAVTEVHHGCTREEQLRWLIEVWNAAEAVRAEGADIRAVTVWSLFGTVDWNSLLTRRDGVYETGPFDVRGPTPRPTALARAAEGLAREGAYRHPVLARAGWWRRDDRFYRPPPRRALALCRDEAAPAPILIVGGDGMLGRAVARVCAHRGLDHVALSRRALDGAEPRAVAAAIACHRPWAVVNALGLGGAASGSGEPGRAASLRIKAEAPGALASACAERDLPLLAFSSDRVFGGGAERSFVESDPVSPGSPVGEAEAEGERRVLASGARALVARAGPLFGPWDPAEPLLGTLRTLARDASVEAPAGSVTPAYVPDLIHVALDLLIDGETGLWHLVNSGGGLPWREVVEAAARVTDLDPGLVGELPADGPRARRALASERGQLLPPLDGAVARFVRDLEEDWRQDAPVVVAAE